MWFRLLCLTLLASLTSTAAAAEIRIASWNLNNLHHRLGEPLRSGAPVRDATDIEALRKYRDRAAADIFAVQEVNGPRAAQLVFPADEWELLFSGRYADDLVTGRESDRIYTGFAVRRGVFDAVTKRDVPALSVRHVDGRPTRWGTEILVEKGGALLRLMSVHLKSGCHGGSLDPASSPDCMTLAAQREPLENWIDAAATAEVPFAIVGDWNRRIGIHGQRDHLWGELDDGDPPGLNLRRLPFNGRSDCNSGFTKPIDFLVFDERAWMLVREVSFEEVVYDQSDWDAARRTPSDHCPIVVALDWPPRGHDRDEAGEARTSAAVTEVAGPALRPLSKLGADQITVSGISSGGFFAHQFHVAWSELVSGAAIMAGGPYACAEQVPGWLSFDPRASIIVALEVCTRLARGQFPPWSVWLPEWPNVQESVATTMAEHARGKIDDPANLANDRVWLLAGRKDKLVPLPIVQALQSYYQTLGVPSPNIHLELDNEANHGVPIEEPTGVSKRRACGEYGSPFLIDCDYDAAMRLLQHLYPQGFKAQAVVPDRTRLLAFDQTEWFDTSDPSVSMAETGYLYVPADCLNGASSSESCRLHVAFHGCQQYDALIGDDFYWDAGYNRWAEANRIVVLYPQTTAWNRPSDPTGLTGNPNGCWDWWGYSGSDYHRRSGKQMQAVRAMIERLLSS